MIAASKIVDKVVSRPLYVTVRDGRVVAPPLSASLAAAIVIPGERLVVSPMTAARLTTGSPDPRIDGSYSWDDVRVLRDALLAATDIRLLADYPQSSSTKAAWRAWRDLLRDITETYPTPALVQWPTPPDAVETA